jgi:bifunctional UDP-N-acetylglucosamine pyrophosphorylase / glucosamine-1-phosphate N-acetyltransferase
MSKDIAVVILAAGKSTRMKSETPKVLHPLCGKPMIAYVLEVVKALKPRKTVIVLGHKHDEVRSALPKAASVVLQRQILGTADAVKRSLPRLEGFKGTVLVLYGDTPLLSVETISKMLAHHREGKLHATLLTAIAEKPAGYGRILRDRYSCIHGIVEEKDASDYQKGIKEINTGIICFSTEGLVFALKRIKPNNQKKEYYLTDAVSLLYQNGFAVGGVKAESFNEAMGINSRVELAQAQKIMQKKINETIMQAGVTMVDPDTVSCRSDARIGADTVLYPFVVIDEEVVIGKNCRIGPFVHIKAKTRVKDGSILLSH